MKHKVKIKSQNKTVGIELTNEGNKVVAVRRALPNHMLKKPLAWAFSEEVIEFLQDRGVEEIKIICNNMLYTCKMSDFLKLAVRFERGFGPQRHLPLRYWTTTKLETQRPKEKQMNLFV
jgi:predicted house-cleaning noncanonical NTP pyrophosphatase (MazG superfamily)